MEKNLLRIGPWMLLLTVGTIATPRYANTARHPLRSILTFERR